MPRFSKISEIRLAMCHKDLQVLFDEIIKNRDCTILCGYRNKQDQDEAFAKGKSQLKFPKSKHNKEPALAVDVAPYPIDWNDKDKFIAFAEFVMKTYRNLRDNKLINNDIRWGGDWNQDGDWKDENFLDLVHFEII